MLKNGKQFFLYDYLDYSSGMFWAWILFWRWKIKTCQNFNEWVDTLICKISYIFKLKHFRYHLYFNIHTLKKMNKQVNFPKIKTMIHSSKKFQNENFKVEI